MPHLVSNFSQPHRLRIQSSFVVPNRYISLSGLVDSQYCDGCDHVYHTTLFSEILQGADEDHLEYVLGYFSAYSEAKDEFYLVDGSPCYDIQNLPRGATLRLTCGETRGLVVSECPTCYYTLEYSGPQYCLNDTSPSPINTTTTVLQPFSVPLPYRHFENNSITLGCENCGQFEYVIDLFHSVRQTGYGFDFVLGYFKSFDPVRDMFLLEDGDYCDLTSASRSATLQLVCDEGRAGTIISVLECPPCVYTIALYGSEFCWMRPSLQPTPVPSNPTFQPTVFVPLTDMPDYYFTLSGQTISTTCAGMSCPDFTYDITFFESISQFVTFSGEENSLGKFRHDSYNWTTDTFHLFGGTMCLNGPRTSSLQLFCGPEAGELFVDEPEICFYVIELHDPMFCFVTRQPTLNPSRLPTPVPPPPTYAPSAPTRAPTPYVSVRNLPPLLSALANQSDSLTCSNGGCVDYVYEFNFFRSINQYYRGSRVYSLGQFRSDSFNVSVNTFSLYGGTPCPSGQPRRSILTLSCDDLTRGLTVSESPLCVYNIHLSGPSYCASTVVYYPDPDPTPLPEPSLLPTLSSTNDERSDTLILSTGSIIALAVGIVLCGLGVRVIAWALKVSSPVQPELTDLELATSHGLTATSPSPLPQPSPSQVIHRRINEEYAPNSTNATSIQLRHHDVLPHQQFHVVAVVVQENAGAVQEDGDRPRPLSSSADFVPQAVAVQL